MYRSVSIYKHEYVNTSKNIIGITSSHWRRKSILRNHKGLSNYEIIRSTLQTCLETSDFKGNEAEVHCPYLHPNFRKFTSASHLPTPTWTYTAIPTKQRNAGGSCPLSRNADSARTSATTENTHLLHFPVLPPIGTRFSIVPVPAVLLRRARGSRLQKFTAAAPFVCRDVNAFVRAVKVWPAVFPPTTEKKCN